MIQAQCVPNDVVHSNSTSDDVRASCASDAANNTMNSSADNDIHTTAAEDASNSANSVADISASKQDVSNIVNTSVEDTTNKTNAEVDNDNAGNDIHASADPIISNSAAKAVDMDNTAKAFNPEESSCALWRLIQPTYPSLAPAACR